MARNWPRFVLVDHDQDRRRTWEDATRAVGVDMRTIASLPSDKGEGQRQVRLLVIQPTDAMNSGMDLVRTLFPAARVIVAGPGLCQTTAVEAFRAGADDFIGDDADRSERLALLNRHLHPDIGSGGEPDDSQELVGDSMAMRELRGFLRRLAPSSATVLINGETGTGKDRAAVQLHRLSRRARGPLVALNCAAIPEALLEGELFGYERGAFSGALSAYPGKLKLADGGTLFLDEIGELSLTGQAKVLRAIETREVFRLGARAPTRFDVRIIAATNRNLEEEKDAGRFREDLYYRLAVAQVQMPPLRERPEDVAPIARHLLRDLCATAGQGVVRIDEAALSALQEHDWPGNVRELRNVLEVAMVSADQGRIRRRDLPLSVRSRPTQPARPTDERARLLDVLAQVGGNKSLAAQALNCSRMTLYRKLARYQLQDETDTVIGTVTSSADLSRGLSHQL